MVDDFVMVDNSDEDQIAAHAEDLELSKQLMVPPVSPPDKIKNFFRDTKQKIAGWELDKRAKDARQSISESTSNTFQKVKQSDALDKTKKSLSRFGQAVVSMFESSDEDQEEVKDPRSTILKLQTGQAVVEGADPRTSNSQSSNEDLAVSHIMQPADLADGHEVPDIQHDCLVTSDGENKKSAVDSQN